MYSRRSTITIPPQHKRQKVWRQPHAANAYKSAITTLEWYSTCTTHYKKENPNFGEYQRRTNTQTFSPNHFCVFVQCGPEGHTVQKHKTNMYIRPLPTCANQHSRPGGIAVPSRTQERRSANLHNPNAHKQFYPEASKAGTLNKATPIRQAYDLYNKVAADHLLLGGSRSSVLMESLRPRSDKHWKVVITVGT